MQEHDWVRQDSAEKAGSEQGTGDEVRETMEMDLEALVSMLNSHGHDVGTKAAAFGCWPGLACLIFTRKFWMYY